MQDRVLDRRALNRATLERQLLLRRVRLPAAVVIEHLVALQAQVPHDPYVALWSRIEGFRPGQLSDLVAARAVVRVPLLRATIHLATAPDCLALRPLLQPVLERCLFSQSPFGRGLEGMDVAALVAAGRALVEERPRTRSELRPLLSARWPERDVESLVQGVTYLLPVVQVPPRGLWGGRGQATWTTVEHWLGAPMAAAAPVEATMLRYLRAFGPATDADARVWSGLTGLREVFERIRAHLVTFRDERGRELFDLPDAPRPDGGAPAPVRFLPEYDNVGLSHADRSRMAGRPLPPWPPPGSGGMLGTVLVDGFAAGFWRITRTRAGMSTAVATAAPLATGEEQTVGEEALRLLELVAPGAGHGTVTFHSAA